MGVFCSDCGFTGRIKDELVPKSGMVLSCPFCKSKIFIKRERPAKRNEGKTKGEVFAFPPDMSHKSKGTIDRFRKRPNLFRLLTAIAVIIFVLLGFFSGYCFHYSGLDEKVPPLARLMSREWRDRGKTYAEEGDLLNALLCFSKAIELDPDSTGALSGRGNSFRELGRYEEALKDLDRAVSLDPSFGDALYNRGLLYDEMKMSEEAISDYTKAISLDPDDIKSLNNRGVTYGNMGRYVEAIEDFNAIISIDPDSFFAYRNRGFTYYISGEVDKALDDFKKSCDMGNEAACESYEKLLKY